MLRQNFKRATLGNNVMCRVPFRSVTIPRPDRVHPLSRRISFCLPLAEAPSQMLSSLPWLADALQDMSSHGILRHRRTIRALEGGLCEIDGRLLTNCASNDYLNLAGDSRVIDAAKRALMDAGVGSRASPLICGRTEWHERLERSLAKFENQQAAILFPTGHAANVGAISALIGPQDVVFCDRMNHASLIEGCRVSGAKLKIYRHDDLRVLKRELTTAGNMCRKWIVTDSVFSMDGDHAPLRALCAMAEEFGAYLFVDEAHGTGVFGQYGRGVAELQGVEDQIAVRVGTLSKAIGTLGGFVAGSQELIDYLWNKAGSQKYSTALPPAICAAAATALEIIMTEPCHRERLSLLSASFRESLLMNGIEFQPGSVGPIVPIVFADPLAAVGIANQLENRGFLVGAIRPPTVPQNTSRLRIVVTCAHTENRLKQLSDEIKDVIRSTF